MKRNSLNQQIENALTLSEMFNVRGGDGEGTTTTTGEGAASEVIL